MSRLSDEEMIGRGDDYFDIADAIYPFGDWRLRSTAKALREAAGHLLRCDRIAYRQMYGKIQNHKIYFRDLPEGLKRDLIDYVGPEIAALIQKHLVALQRAGKPERTDIRQFRDD
jgi:hypothetical protein